MAVPLRVPVGNWDWATNSMYWLDSATEQVSTIVNGYTDTSNTFHPFPPAGFSRYIPRDAAGASECQAMRAMNEKWPTASLAEKDAMFHYWGTKWGFKKNNMPLAPFDMNNIGELEEYVRSFFFSPRRMPKCHTCRVVARPTPSANSDHALGTLLAAKETPIGLDPDIMPCGCNYHDALFEMWCILTGRWAKRYHPNRIFNPDMQIDGMFHRHNARLLSTGLALVPGTAPPSPHFQDYADRHVRLAALQAEIAALGPLDNGVAPPVGKWNRKT